MKSINRTALLFQPKQPFIDWMNANEKSGYVYKLEERRNDASLYLINQIKEYKEVDDLIKKNFQKYFERELIYFPYDKGTWPDTANIETFRTWIDFTFHTIVNDSSDLPLEWIDYSEDI